MAEYHRPSIAVLASGGASTMEAFVHASQEGIVDADVSLVISDRPENGSFEVVQRLNKQYGLDIRTEEVNAHRYPLGPQERGQTLQEAEIISKLVDDEGCALVALMGYLKIVAKDGDLMRKYGWNPSYAERFGSSASPHGILECRMLNTHPGILPATANTYGIHAQERVLRFGLTETAHTVHAVAAGVDTGPKYAEHPVPVLPGDDADKLFKRVQRIEKANLPIDIDNFLKQQAEMKGQ